MIFAAFAAHAEYPPYANGGTIECREKTNGPTIIQYVLKTTPSRRLGSDIIYHNGTTHVILSSLNVAQIDASKSEIYTLIDNVNEEPIVAFQARNPLVGKAFKGAVQDIAASTGAVTKTRNVTCTITP